jgi:hypothetical protein
MATKSSAASWQAWLRLNHGTLSPCFSDRKRSLEAS